MTTTNAPTGERNPNLFTAQPDAYLHEDYNLIVKPPAVQTNVVDLPACGYWVVVWLAYHPETKRHNGGSMMVTKDGIDQRAAKSTVSEILWSRGYTGDYTLTVRDGWRVQ